MDGPTAAAANSIRDVSQILKMATAANLDMAKKLLKVNVEAAVKGSETGKGNVVDISA